MITVVVASKNRPNHLLALLESLKKQTQLPAEVIIVDASDSFAKIEDSNLPFKVTHVPTKDSSISRQRNLGKRLIDSNTKYLSILDDDTYPEEKYLEKVVDFLEVNEQVAGASGITFPPNDYMSTSKVIHLIKSIFFLDSQHSGIITKGGINIGLRTHSLTPLKTEWLIGCSVFRMSLIKTLEYEGSLDGYSLGEDVLFSYRVAKLGDLFLLPGVQINHHEVSKSSHYRPEYWYKWSKNRRLLIVLMPGRLLKWVFYTWSNLGQTLIVLCNPRIDSRLRFQSALKIIKGTFNV